MCDNVNILNVYMAKQNKNLPKQKNLCTYTKLYSYTKYKFERGTTQRNFSALT